MSEHSSSQKSVDDEVDLSFIFSAIGRFFKNLLKGFLRIIGFFYRHKFVLVTLVIFGVVIGYFIDKNVESPYKSNFIVSANYNSADYLYNKVEAIDKKLIQQDTIALEKIFGDDYEMVKRIEIEPILNIYGFIGQSTSNAELFELLSVDEDMKEFINEPVNSRNYPFHNINIVIQGNQNHKTVSQSFFTYLNANEYYQNLKQVNIKNDKKQLKQNDSVKKQIDKIINSLSNKNLEKDELLVSISDNNVLDDLLKRKRDLLNSERYLENNLINKQEIISIVDSNYALDYDKKITEKDKKILLPLLLLVLYTMFFFFSYTIRKSKRFLEQNK